uniref:GST C-terminal domain-containing protein n=1 Tax=Palpitomonas bilix TaxID=652834 RepID=A0A7S3GBE4_9EUKA|mmetsp:Transcript_43131/g.111797  ORF Transcript_43131/g.111797 Transcript_43131/m.111797 type:complete len:249 (+) Transcript_43131:23-769(+)
MHRLITIRASHFCEKARWALDAAGVKYVEESHFPLLNRAFTVPKGGVTTPLLVCPDGKVLKDSNDIVRYADAHLTAPSKLIPQEWEGDIAKWMDKANQIGIHSRRVVYFHLFKYMDSSVYETLSDGVGTLEKVVGWSLLPLIKFAIKKGLRVDERGHNISKEKLDKLLDEVDGQLEGKQYIVGNGFSAADLAVASLLAPIIFPPFYGAHLPDFRESPPQVKALVEQYRARPSGKHCMAMFSQLRKSKL